MELAESLQEEKAQGEDSGTMKMKKSSPERSSTSGGKSSRKRQFRNLELPTPPPEPNGFDPVSPYESSRSKASTLGVVDAFDHLDKLHSMMGEILEMRERSAKLFRRVRDLERVRVTRKAHQEAEKLIRLGNDVVLPDEDVGFAESLLGAMLSSSFELGNYRNGRVRSGRVTRSRSVGMEHRRVSCPVTIDTRQRIINRSVPRSEIKKKRPSLEIGTPKISKWTRVKAAFKWERAACTNNDVPNETDASLRYLKIPENTGGSSEVSGPPTPAGTISSSSSIDDVFHRPQRPSSNQSGRITRRDENTDPSRRSRSLDGDASLPMNFAYNPRPRSKDNFSPQGKGVDPRVHKTPWGKVKDMMQLRRDSIGRLPTRSISRNEDGHSTSSLDSSDILRSEAEGRSPRVRATGETSAAMTTNLSKSGSTNVSSDLVDLASRRLTPTLTITVPSSEELRSIFSPESITPSPPSPRQSFESGKSDRSSQAGYETPRETRTGQISSASSSSGILRYGVGRQKTSQTSPGDYKRQQSLKGESLGSSPKMQRRDSKWNKVKRAFLTSATSVPTSPSRISSYFFDDGDATGGSYSASASAEDLENETATSPSVQAEIERNYRLLHDKFGAEFYRKLAEWEKLKSNPSARDSSRQNNARERDSENLRLLGEERLTPEFKKKLEEWKKMNKGGASSSENRSANRRRITDWQLWKSTSKSENKIESPRLSEDFIKKMEEWKRIKSARRETEIEEIPRTEVEEDHEEEDEEDEEETIEYERQWILEKRLSERRRKAWKSLEDEEFRSLEKILETMENDRQMRLSKLQRIVGSQPQKNQEVLIHTSTGLYRFEGISRKFTRKLYEWEKSQGISPELSTFRLLDPLRHGVGTPRTRAIAVDASYDETPRRSRNRSKSVGCVDIDCWRTNRDPVKTIRRPCSLSLNDIDNIDPRNCITACSIPTIPDEEDTSEDIAMEDSEAEPEAVIVEIEDVIEETASPLRKYQPHQTPVYSVAGSETTSIAIPLGTVTARHEPSPVILIEPGEIYPLRARESRACPVDEVQMESFFSLGNRDESSTNSASASSSIDGQRQRSIARDLRCVGTNDFNELPTERDGRNDKSQLVCITGCQEPDTEESSVETRQMAPLTCEKSEEIFLPRQKLSSEDEFENSVITVNSDTRYTKKLLKTRRLTDTQVSYDWSRSDPATSEDSIDPKTETEIDLLSRMDEFEKNPNVERIIINEDTLNKIVVPTASSSSTISTLNSNDSCQGPEDLPRKEKREPASVFVKTKRIVFSPFRRESKSKVENCPGTRTEKITENLNIKGPNDSKSELIKSEQNSAQNKNEKEISEISKNLEFDPSIPKSPILPRKEYKILRETSPGIKMMIRRYNDKLEENFDREPVRSSIFPGQNIAGSSLAGKTPQIEGKRHQEFPLRSDRYDEAMKTLSSRGIRIPCSRKPSLSKSSSIDFPRQRSNFEQRREKTMEPEFLIPNLSPQDQNFLENNEMIFGVSSARALKIRRAKENFLSMGTSGSDVDPSDKNSISTQEIDKNSEEDSDEKKFSSDIVKSASAGMINVDESTYERLQNAGENGDERGCVSLPRSNEHLRYTETKKESTSRFSQIAKKFRRARFRRAKDKSRENQEMSTVLKLCRQSLFVDIEADDDSKRTSETNFEGESSRSQEEKDERREKKKERND